jgi:hypothetical protein
MNRGPGLAVAGTKKMCPRSRDKLPKNAPNKTQAAYYDSFAINMSSERASSAAFSKSRGLTKKEFAPS